MKSIDAIAPVVARMQRRIAAPLRTVWQIHSDVARWPAWQSDIRSAAIDGDGLLAPGTTFTWCTRGIDEPIRSTVFVIDPNHRTLWGGPAKGIDGIHEWRFTGDGDATIVETSESWSGELARRNPAQLQVTLESSLDHWLEQLDQRATAR